MLHARAPKETCVWPVLRSKCIEKAEQSDRRPEEVVLHQRGHVTV